MKRITNPEKSIVYLEYINRENDFRHTYYDEEMKQYRLLQIGDLAGVEESTRMMLRNQNTYLSKDPVQNIKYLFVACTTIATRFAIEGGLRSETAYNISDLYIRQLDSAKTIDEVMAIHNEMFSFFTKKMQNIKREMVYSKHVIQAIDYIDHNLHTKLTAQQIADAVGLNRTYFSTLFKGETRNTVADYIMIRKIEVAKQMLLYSGLSASQIAEIFAFSSQSHFIKNFKDLTGFTPKEYVSVHSYENINAAKDNYV